LASRQGFGELKTEQLGGHSQEQQHHRQAPIDDELIDGFKTFFHVKQIKRTYTIGRNGITLATSLIVADGVGGLA